MKLLRLSIVAFFCLITITSYSQKKPVKKVEPLKLEELPRRPVDTIKTEDPETKVIIFSNNTWEFYRPEISNRLSDHDAYKYNWDTTYIFAYRNIELTDIPDVVELELYNDDIKFCSPIKGRILSKFGMRGRARHNGVDIPLRTGEPIHATFDGKIRYAKLNTGGYGFMVIIRHPNGLETWYAHLSRINSRVGDYVKAGQIIGYGGSTGRSYGPHLHYEMRYKDQAFDPEFLVNFEKGEINNQYFNLEKRFLSIHSRASEMLDEPGFEVNAPGTLLADANDSTAVKIQNPKPKPQSTPVYHTVKSGDTLGHLAVKYKVSVDQICKLNNITRTSNLKLNRKLRVK